MDDEYDEISEDEDMEVGLSFSVTILIYDYKTISKSNQIINNRRRLHTMKVEHQELHGRRREEGSLVLPSLRRRVPRRRCS